jgi:hypothetical protein
MGEPLGGHDVTIRPVVPLVARTNRRGGASGKAPPLRLWMNFGLGRFERVADFAELVVDLGTQERLG